MLIGCVHSRKYLQIIYESIFKIIWRNDFHFLAKTATPTEKHITYLYIGGELNFIVTDFGNFCLLAELIENNVDQIGRGFKRYGRRLTAKHRKDLLAIIAQIYTFRVSVLIYGRFEHSHFHHTIYSIIGKRRMIIVIAHKIVVIVRENHCNGIGDVSMPFPTKHSIAVYVIVEILEYDFSFAQYRFVYLINTVINIFIRMLGSIELNNILFQNLGAIAATESGNLIYKFRSFLLGNKTCSLNGVNKYTQFGNIKISINDVI